MADHFTLDADPEVLKQAEKWLGDIGTQLEEEGGKLAALPGQSGSALSGGTATVLKQAVTLLAADMRAGAPHLSDAVKALVTFRQAVQAAKEALPSLNSRWEQAQTTRDAAVAGADKAYTDAKRDTPSGVWNAEQADLSATRGIAKTHAESTLAESQKWLTYEWTALSNVMTERAQELDTALTNAVSRAVPPEMTTSGTVPPGYGFDASLYLKGMSPFPSPVEQTVQRLVDQGVLPPETAGMTPDELTAYLVQNPTVAQALVAHAPQPGSTDPVEAALAALADPQAPGSREAVRQFFEQYTADDQAMLAVLFPAQVGNLSGAPFAARAAGNRVAIIATNADLDTQIAGMEAELEKPAVGGAAGMAARRALQERIDALKAQQATYQSVIANPGRQVVMFDPVKGGFAELSGDIDAGTDNVGVLVPGTGAGIATINADIARSDTFVDAAGGSLAMITYVGGEMPQSVAEDSPWASYSRAIAPDLAAFTHDVRQEIESSQAAGAQLTLAGHSYGGAVVGLAETQGADADRILHIESAGMGNEVDDIGDLHPTNPNVRRYSMTAPGDPIGYIQGIDMGSLGHGADPDTFQGVQRVETGKYADGSMVEGADAHGGVFKVGSDSWNQMYQVFTGGAVTEYGGYEPKQIYLPTSAGFGGGMWVDNPDYRAFPQEIDVP